MNYSPTIHTLEHYVTSDLRWYQYAANSVCRQHRDDETNDRPPPPTLRSTNRSTYWLSTAVPMKRDPPPQCEKKQRIYQIRSEYCVAHTTNM